MRASASRGPARLSIRARPAAGQHAAGIALKDPAAGLSGHMRTCELRHEAVCPTGGPPGAAYAPGARVLGLAGTGDCRMVSKCVSGSQSSGAPPTEERASWATSGLDAAAVARGLGARELGTAPEPAAGGASATGDSSSGRKALTETCGIRRGARRLSAGLTLIKRDGLQRHDTLPLARTALLHTWSGADARLSSESPAGKLLLEKREKPCSPKDGARPNCDTDVCGDGT
jgi:hypothetical protein